MVNSKNFSMQCLIIAFVLTLIGANEDECGAMETRPIYCYECQSYSDGTNVCGDPFNNTRMGNNYSVCNGHCVKWVREAKPGVMLYKRTCSTSLQIRMSINVVCVEESRPRSGQICFCRDSKCNKSNIPEMDVSVVLSALFVFLTISINRR